MNHEQKKYRNKLNGYGVTFIVGWTDSWIDIIDNKFETISGMIV